MRRLSTPPRRPAGFFRKNFFAGPAERTARASLSQPRTALHSSPGNSGGQLLLFFIFDLFLHLLLHACNGAGKKKSAPPHRAEAHP